MAVGFSVAYTMGKVILSHTFPYGDHAVLGIHKQLDILWVTEHMEREFVYAYPVFLQVNA
jgi:hypothetical protein